MAYTTSILGRTLFIFANLLYSAGAFLADYSESHVFNPTWPPHARFHNGQTMSMGVLLTLLSVYLLFRPAASSIAKRDNIWLAAVASSLYCVSALSAILYPGTAWADKGYEPSVPAAQAYLFTVQVIAVWISYRLEVQALGKSKTV